MRVGPQCGHGYKAKLFSTVIFPVKTGFQNPVGRFPRGQIVFGLEFPG